MPAPIMLCLLPPHACLRGRHVSLERRGLARLLPAFSTDLSIALRSINPEGNPQSHAQLSFPARHLPVIPLVIVSAQMQQPVQHQDLHLLGRAVAELARTLAWQSRREMAISPANFFRDIVRRGKRKHVGRLVFSAKTPVQRLHLYGSKSPAHRPSPSSRPLAERAIRKRVSATSLRSGTRF